MGNALYNKDATAQGVAKVRHYESMFPEEQRLYYDPYAGAMFLGSFVQEWIGTAGIESIYMWMGMPGLLEALTIRTKWIDDEIIHAVKEEDAKQFIILGAGYDTRGFRLDLPDEFKTFEIDQPIVQQKKIENLQWLVKKKDAKEIKEKMESKKVEFISVDFNHDSLDEKLATCEGYKSDRCSIITLEGVTQYIPKESTADTLKKMKKIVAPGSTLLISYIPAQWLDEDDAIEKPKAVRSIMKVAKAVGEPWISGWAPMDFADFLKECGYVVTSDSTMENYNNTYMESVGRKFGESAILNLERFAVAKVL
mmetsp:Transcript_24368/g.35436  ORF Transcript_24368/g.35436 Transcript_24368/m.35436 type:complete len:309 (-) Transcript_24368:44-970(-)